VKGRWGVGEKSVRRGRGECRKGEGIPHLPTLVVTAYYSINSC